VILATAIVDTHALLQLVYVSLIAGIGICVVYAVAVIGVTRSSERRRAERRVASALYAALATIAAAGVTGDPGDLTRAHSVLTRALSQGREIIVVTRAEIEQLTEISQLILLLKRKRAQLAVSGTIYQIGRK